MKNVITVKSKSELKWALIERLWEDEAMPRPVLAAVVQVETNRRAAVCECVDAILAQTLNGVAVILMDAGKSETVSRLCDEYAKYHRQVVVVHEEEAWSFGVSMNAGMRIAQAMDAEFVNFVTRLERFDMRAYERMVQKAREMKADVVCCGTQLCHQTGLRDRLIEYREPYYGDFGMHFVDDDVFGETKVLDLMTDGPGEAFRLDEFPAMLLNLLNVDACVFRKAFLESNAGYWDEEMCRVTAQIPFLMRVFLKAKRIAVQKEYLVRRRCNEFDLTEDMVDVLNDPMAIGLACGKALDILAEHRGHIDDLGKLGYALAAFVAVKNRSPYNYLLFLKTWVEFEHGRKLLELCAKNELGYGNDELRDYALKLQEIFRRLDGGDTLMDEANEFLTPKDVAFIRPFLAEWLS